MLSPLSPVADARMIRSLVKSYAEHCGCAVDAKVLSDAFIHRHCHAGRGMLGRMIRLLVDALTEALLEDAPMLVSHHFALAFHRKTFCIDGMNVFITDDFTSIDTSRLFLGHLEEEDRP